MPPKKTKSEDDNKQEDQGLDSKPKARGRPDFVKCSQCKTRWSRRGKYNLRILSVRDCTLTWSSLFKAAHNQDVCNVVQTNNAKHTLKVETVPNITMNYSRGTRKFLKEQSVSVG